MQRESSGRLLESTRPDTLVARFIDRAASDPARVAYHVYPMGALQPFTRLTWGDWLTQSRSASGALLTLHAAKGARVAIFSDNRAMWPIAAMGAMMCGLVPVAVDPHCGADELVARIAESGAAIVAVDTIARFKLLRSIQAALPHHITIICDDLEPYRTSVAEGVYEFESWCRAGAQALDEYESLRSALNARIESVLGNDTALVSFDAGAGQIELSHENLTRTTAAIANIFALTFKDRVSSYKPFTGAFEFSLAIGATIHVGLTAALLEHQSDAFSVARQFEASIFSGAPRAFSKLREAFEKAHETGSYLRDTVCEILGRHCRLAVLASGVLPESLHRDLRSGGVALATVYGTALHACVCVNGMPKFDDSAIGFPFPDIELRVGDHDELLFRSKAVSASDNGVTHQATDSAIEWLNTGDRVQPTDAGSFRPVGHVRDLLKLQNNRAVAPQVIEQALQSLPFVAHAVCHADGDPTIVAVLSLKRAEVEAWALKQGVAMPWDALVSLPLVYDELARGLARINARYEIPYRVAAFAPTDLEFTVHTGELNDAGEVVRSVIASRFRHVFADLHKQAQS